jgi:hypothetical protein
MEHLQAADGHNKVSWFINTLCLITGGLGTAIQNNWFVSVSALGILINAGFTLDKWYQMRKLIKKGDKPNVD